MRPGHRASTAHIQAAYPCVADGGLGGRGVYICKDVYEGSFCYDPWELYGRELPELNQPVCRRAPLSRNGGTATGSHVCPCGGGLGTYVRL